MSIIWVKTSVEGQFRWTLLCWKQLKYPQEYTPLSDNNAKSAQLSWAGAWAELGNIWCKMTPQWKGSETEVSLICLGTDYQFDLGEGEGSVPEVSLKCWGTDLSVWLGGRERCKKSNWYAGAQTISDLREGKGAVGLADMLGNRQSVWLGGRGGECARGLSFYPKLWYLS